MPVISLRKSHPQLWATVVLVDAIHATIMFVVVAMSASLAPSLPYVIPTGLVVGLITYGLIVDNYRWLRWGMFGGLFVSSLIGFYLLVLLGLTIYESGHGQPLSFPELRTTAFLIPPWVLFAAVHLLVLREPPENPLTDRRPGRA